MYKSSVSKIEKYLDQALFVGFCFLVFAVPLVFSPQADQQFDLPKITLLRIASLLLFLLWLTKILLSPQVKIKRNYLDLPILAFLGLALLSTLFSVDLPASFFGKYGRYNGFLTLLNFGGLYFLAAQINWDKPRLRTLLTTLVGGAALASLYGLSQFMGYNLLKWEELRFEANRSSSTFGNPSLLTGYLVLSLPLALSLVLTSHQFSKRLLFGGATLLIFSCILTTFTRGGWIAGIVALLAFVILNWNKLWKERKILGTLFVLFMGVTILIGIFSAKSPSSVTNFLSRATSTAQTEGGSVATRLEIWKSALAMTRERPLSGFGPDTFHLVYPQYESLKKAQLSGHRFLEDSAHNYLLQLSATLGIPAALLFLVIMGWFLLRILGLQRKDFLVVGIFAGSLGYFINILFTINVVGSAFLPWLLFATISEKESRNSFSFTWLGAKNSFIPRLLVLGYIALTVFYLVVTSTFPYLADVHFHKAQRYGLVQFEQAILEYQKAISLNPYTDLYPYHYGKLYLEKERISRNRADFDRGIELLEKAQKISPKDINNYLPLAAAYISGGKRYDPLYYDQALSNLNQGLELHPYSAKVYVLFSLYYLNQGESKKALRAAETALKIDPRYAEAYFSLGLSYRKLEEREKALRAYHKALKLDPSLSKVRQAIKDLENSE